MVAILSGALLSLAFKPFGAWAVAPIAIAIFFLGLKRSRHPYQYVLLFGFTFNAIVLHWSGKFVGALPWLLLSTLQSVYLLPIAFVFKKYRNVFYLLPIFLITELVKSHTPFGGFGWTRFAFSQANAPYISLVKLGGVALVSGVVIFIALLIVEKPKYWKSLIIFLLIAPLFIKSSQTHSSEISFAGVQGNTPSVGLDFNGRAKAVFDLHVKESKRISKNVDIIIWPENAADIDPLQNDSMRLDILDLVSKKGAPLIMGAVLNSRGRLENAAVLFEKDGKVGSIYVKRHLTPFGEYMPLRSLAEFVSPYASSVEDFSAGDKLVLHRINGKPLATVICYEIIDDTLVRESAKSAQALIVLTNSATFAGTAEGAQQLEISRIRAIEHSRAIVSISTVGISALIDQNGNVLKRTDENVSQILYGSLALSQQRSIVDRLGGFSEPLVITLAFIIAWRYRYRR